MTSRSAVPNDSLRIAEIYSQGIAGRGATFETEPRTTEDVRLWFGHSLPLVVVEVQEEVVAFAAAFPYSDRCAYAGIAEFSVYVDERFRGRGCGRLAMLALVEQCRSAGLHKLYSRVFEDNGASLSLLKSIGFREMGTYQKHGKLDGVWRDVIGVELLIEENLI